jgi:hypothetical protein
MTAAEKRTDYHAKKDASLRKKVAARKAIILECLRSGPAKAGTFHQERGYRDQAITMSAIIELRDESKIVYNEIRKAWSNKKS